ncbi:MAG: ornithine cyclodeaminase family protein [Alphaproteobacteria bacterium]|nr:ornithine cyclodeaminase family protein [Alphaproteobacteria bacterium]
MQTLDAAEVERRLDFPSLIDRLREMFRAGCELPTRHHHPVEVPNAPGAILLLMPAWQVGKHIGVKMVTVFPGNGARSLPAVMGIYTLLDGLTGQPLALIDGPMLTLRRTAAASALAATYLAREDAVHHLMIGTGALAPHLIQAHATARPIRRVSIWGRNAVKARDLAAELRTKGLPADATKDLEAAAREADIVTTATLSAEPVVKGAWLKSGAHLDLVGAYTPTMRETDDDAVRRGRVYVDTRGGATKEAGDIVQPLASGALKDIVGDLFDLTRGQVQGRGKANEVTVFKSVGTALEDLAAAQLVYERS